MTIQAEVIAGVEPEMVRRAIEALGGTLESEPGESRIIGAVLPARALAAAAEIEGLVYLEEASLLRPSDRSKRGTNKDLPPR